jgi:hypothetical protein
MARRRYGVTIPLPGEDVGRRRFLVKGLAGFVLLSLGGGTWLATRKTVPLSPVAGEGYRVFSPEEAAVLLAVAERMIPENPGFPRPRELGLVARIDGIAAMADPTNQGELRRLVRLFESALGGLLLDGDPQLFTAASPARQDRRLLAWSRSRVALRRTGYRALKRLVYAAYYSSSEVWPAVGYPGPPLARAATVGAPAGPERLHGDR